MINNIHLEPPKTFDNSGRRLYLAACASIGVTPVSYFLRHIQDKDMLLRHHGLGPKGSKAIAIALVVSYCFHNASSQKKQENHTNYFSLSIGLNRTKKSFSLVVQSTKVVKISVKF